MLASCHGCSGFLPDGATSCPNCGARRAPASAAWTRVAAGILATAAGGGMAMTLMACYGQPACEHTEDKDKDGYFVCVGSGRLETPRDCNDDDPAIHPGAADPLGDGVDQNCDGQDGVRAGTASASGSASVMMRASPSASAAAGPSGSGSAAPSAAPSGSAKHP